MPSRCGKSGLRFDDLPILHDFPAVDPLLPNHRPAHRQLLMYEGTIRDETIVLLLHGQPLQLPIDGIAHAAIGWRLTVHVLPMLPD